MKVIDWVGEKFSGFLKPYLSDDKEVIPKTDSPRRTHGSSTIYNADTFMKIPPFPMRYTDMYEIFKLEVVTRTCALKIRQEIFRRSFKWEPKWTSKCPECGEEYKGDVPMDSCPKCSPDSKKNYFDLLTKLAESEDPSTTLPDFMLGDEEDGTTGMEYPDKKKHEGAEQFLHCCNRSGQDLKDVLGQCEDDIQAVDDAYLVVRKKYVVNKKGTIIKSKVVELLRGSPQLIRKVIDQFNRVGGRWYKCIRCNKVVEFDKYGRRNMDDTVGQDPSMVKPLEPPKCSCGAKMHDVIYFEMTSEYGHPEHFYIDGEVIHWQYYSPSSSYGLPPIVTLYVIQAALIFQNVYIRDFFEKRKIPPGFLSIITANPKSFWSFWKKAMKKWKVDKQYMPVAISEPEGGMGGAGGAKFIKVMDTLAEMQYTEARNEMRQRISSFYGVSNIFMDDTKHNGSGSVGEGQQLVVTNRTVEAKQRIYNEYVLPMLCEMMGVKDWCLQIQPSEDRDIMKEKQNLQLDLQNAQMFKSIGFEVDIDANGKWVYWKPEIAEEQMARVEEIVKTLKEAEMEAEQEQMMGEQPLDQGGAQSYQPDTNATPNGEGKTKQDKANITKGNKEMVVPQAQEGDRPKVTPGQSVQKVWTCTTCGHQTNEKPKSCPECNHTEFRETDPKPVKKGNGLSASSKMGSGDLGRAGRGRTNSPLGKGAGTSGSTHTPGSGKSSYKCKVCGRTFTSKQQLGGHMKSAHGEETGYEVSGVDKQTKIENLNLMIQDFLVFLSRAQRPSSRVNVSGKREK